MDSSSEINKNKGRINNIWTAGRADYGIDVRRREMCIDFLRHGDSTVVSLGKCPFRAYMLKDLGMKYRYACSLPFNSSENKCVYVNIGIHFTHIGTRTYR